ncbi:hypothetical protein PG996_001566 [Apiospora saccharicola]|uniref:Uncharacterized protein n=1 Tax=Apiospora saccharicola TaxID=335842 RepID=A0ABR1WH12_9PEZI
MAAQAKMATHSGSSLWGTQSAAQALSRLTTTRRHRIPFMSNSPTRVLGLWLQRNDPQQRKRYGFLFRTMARIQNERLPLITLQKLMRKKLAEEEGANEAAPEDKALSRYEGLRAIIHGTDPKAWQDRLNSLASQGWDEEKLDHVVWILSAETADARIKRFVSSNEPKPLFLTKLLVQSDQYIRKPESLRTMIDYIQRVHTSYAEEVGPSAKLRAKDFLQLLSRLIRHAQRLFPSAVEDLGDLSRWYIQSIPLEPLVNGDKREGSGYHKRCSVFNHALDLFSRPAPMQPLLNREFEWRAQCLLLHMSDTMARPLVIDKTSYRAIRKVLVGLKKSTAERWVAMRYSKSWPPYRQDFDGHDAKRTYFDDQSRSVKAGTLMTAAGYAENDYDRALGALGGMTLGSPTVQTRSQPPKEWRNDESHQNFYTMWAMKIRSTRNAQEAWRHFNTFTDAEPNLQIYAEVFMKIQPSRTRVETVPQCYSGDAREASPIHEANLSEYELARLNPPTVGELYNRMLNHNIRPNGACLRHLVSIADTVEQGLDYLRDSALDPEAVSQLRVGGTRLEFGVLRRIPLLVFSSYIHLLCNKQPNRAYGEHRYTRAFGELRYIRHAIELVKTRLRPNTSEWAFFRPAWQMICKALSRPYVAVLGGSELGNAREALRIFLEFQERAERAIGPDLEIFIYLCRALQKVLILQYPEGMPIQGDELVGEAHSIMNDIFSVFSSHVAQPDIRLFQSIGPVHLHTYMRTLAILGDNEGMVNLMDWTLRNKSYFDSEIERIGKGQSMLAKTLCAFEAFTRMREDQRGHLDSLMQNWRWPTLEEVQDYVEADTTGISQRLYEQANGMLGDEMPSDETIRDEMASNAVAS